MAESIEELATGMIAEKAEPEGEAVSPEDALLEETQADGPPAEGEQAEGEQAEGEQPDDDQAARDLWDETCPDLAGHYDDLTVKTREGILVKKLAARGERETAAKDSTRLESADTDSEPSRPPVIEIPTVDHAALQKDMQQAIDNGEPERVVEIAMKGMTEQEARTDAVMDAVLGAIRESGQKLEGFEKTLSGVTMPGELRGLLSSIPGASEVDILPAMDLLRAGDVKKPELALKLAMGDRTRTLAGGKRQASESSRRKARGLAASQARGEARKLGQHIDNTIPTRMNSDAGRALAKGMLDEG